MLKGLVTLSSYRREMGFKEHKAELEQSKNSIFKLKIVQHLQHSMKQKLFIVRLSQSRYFYPTGGRRAMTSSSTDSCIGSWVMKNCKFCHMIFSTNEIIVCYN